MGTYREDSQVAKLDDLTGTVEVPICGSPGQRIRRVAKTINVGKNTIGAAFDFRLQIARGTQRFDLAALTVPTTDGVAFNRAVVLEQGDTIILDPSRVLITNEVVQSHCSFADIRHPETSANGLVRSSGIVDCPEGQTTVLESPGQRIARTIPWIGVHNADTVSHQVWAVLTPPGGPAILLDPGPVSVAADETVYFDGPWVLREATTAVQIAVFNAITFEPVRVYVPYWEERDPEVRA